ncbi:MAG: hypothetical protein RL698_3595 [Pseudomonadota bacterium]|jgi:predicted RNA-binding protein YlxR (DUF448 family)
MTRARNTLRTAPKAHAALRPRGGGSLHVPVRICAGCGRPAPQVEMRRLALGAGRATVEWRKSGGRGTYLHQAGECERLFVAGKRRLPGLRALVPRAAREALLGLGERPPRVGSDRS